MFLKSLKNLAQFTHFFYISLREKKNSFIAVINGVNWYEQHSFTVKFKEGNFLGR